MRQLAASALTVALTCAFALAQDTNSPAPIPAPQQAAASVAPTSVAPALPTTLTEDQLKQLIQKAADNDQENDKKVREYTYTQREEDHKLDGKGAVKSTESNTSEVLMLYGSEVDKLVAKNDKPLSPKDAAKEDERIQKIIDKREHESESDRRKRLEKEEKDQEESRQWVGEIADAYNFQFAGMENLSGREAYVIDGTPRPGFKPNLKYANYLSKFRFRVWIDQADVQLSKLDAEAIDTVSWGLFLARIHKGSHFLIEQTRVNDEVWLPKYMALKADVRLALLKNFNVSQETTYSDYKKFRVDSKIVSVGELK